MLNCEMRRELIQHLEALADTRYQQECWVKGHCPPGIEYDEFDYVVHFIFDDTPLSDNPNNLIGVVLCDTLEADAIKQLTCSLNSIFDNYGMNLSDSEYITKPEWRDVVASAQKALNIFRQNNQN